MAQSTYAKITNLGWRSDRVVRTFNDRYPFLGPLFWIMSLQYLAMQVIVAQSWPAPGYSWRDNAISDLGATVCNPFNSRFICSPQHALMNFSFMILGLTMFAGSWLIYHEFRRNRHSCYGFIAMAIAGIGAVMVGTAPENVNSAVHFTGAILAFGVGDIGLVLFALTLTMGKIIKWYTLLSGIVGLSGLALYSTGNFLGLGLGGMERIAGYPQTLWLIIFGIYMSRNHYLRLRTKSR